MYAYCRFVYICILYMYIYTRYFDDSHYYFTMHHYYYHMFLLLFLTFEYSGALLTR